MALTKNKKQEIVKELEKAVSGSSSVVFLGYKGLKVGDETKLRSDLRKEGVGYKVSRKTLLMRAVSGKATGEIPKVEGEVAIAYSADPLASAREVYNFQKTYKSPIAILGGIFEGKFVDGPYMTEIATIPPREVLLSKIAFLLNSPMQRLAIAVNEVAKSK